MTIRILPAIRRLFEGTATAVFAPASGSRGHGHAVDFMDQDLAGSVRFYGR